MTTKLYNIVLTEEQHAALVKLHYTGTVCARMVNDRQKTPAPRADLYQEWLCDLSIVQSALASQPQASETKKRPYIVENKPKKFAF